MKGDNFMDQKKIGKFIAELRTEQQLTQTELGEKLGVSYKAVSKWENGICLPDPSLYNELCKIFKITKDELFSGCRREINYKTKISYILLVLCLISIILCISIPTIISNELVAMSLIGMMTIITLGYFTAHIYKLTNIDKDNKKIKFIKWFNYLIIVAIPILIALNYTVKTTNDISEIIVLSIVSLLIACGTFFYRFPYNRYIGLRLPWTVRDESTWVIAHKIIGIISLPISILTFIGTMVFEPEICLTIGILTWILIPSVISGVHFYQLFCRNK